MAARPPRRVEKKRLITIIIIIIVISKPSPSRNNIPFHTGKETVKVRLLGICVISRTNKRPQVEKGK